MTNRWGDWADWKHMFRQLGDTYIQTFSERPVDGDPSIEDIYQAFKARMLEEITACNLTGRTYLSSNDEASRENAQQLYGFTRYDASAANLAEDVTAGIRAVMMTEIKKSIERLNEMWMRTNAVGFQPTDDFKREWNRHADVVRHIYVVPRYP